jgi:hypothetical protein
MLLPLLAGFVFFVTVVAIVVGGNVVTNVGSLCIGSG